MDTTVLKALGPLVVAGFSSPQKAIVNQTIVFWNASFGCQEMLEYPAQLERLLRAWATETDLVLPNFPEGDNEDVSTLLPAFFETQIDAPLQPESPSIVHNDLVHEVGRVPSTAPTARSTHFPARSADQTGKSHSSPATGTTKTSVRSATKARLRHDDSQVRFASIESSPVHYEDSQTLTERQREVKARQRGDAQMFPDLSSSPVAKSSASARSVQKRLDFTSSDSNHAGAGEDAGTPLASQEADGHLSDDLPSSPTPSSTKDVESARMDIGADDDTGVEDACDPPSSPPEQEDDREELGELDVHGLGTAIADTDAGPAHTGHTDDALEPNRIDEGDHHQFESLRVAYQSGSDLPSDTLLPTEQLLFEEQEAAARVEEAAIADEETEGNTFLDGRTVLSETAQPEAAQDGFTGDRQQAGIDMRELEADVSRVEDSCLGEATVDGKEDDAQPITGHQSQRSTRKRKRPSTSLQALKKRKQQSPLKQAMSFFSSFVRRSQEEDGDMEDEIVVASSQPSNSPASARAQQAISSPTMVVEVPPEPVEEKAVPVKEDSTPSQQSQKRARRRGRPRKSETPTPAVSQTEAAPVRSLKRKASVLSTAGSTDEPATSFVKDTPAPSKARRVRRGPDTELVQKAQLSQEESGVGRTTRRTVAAVVLPEQDGHGLAVDEDAGGEPEMESNDGQVRTKGQLPSHESAAAANPSGRKIATPKSILGRLRDVLSDLPKMLLGTQEERELDDVLFEIRKEVYEAGKRAKD